ncbi:MAG: TldE/PmbA family protein, Actinobacterial subgroup [Candidatus Ozemobacter sibiricus]|jgi:predicted Zn-dependent protease|uniref:TldE/PmbA family protein, Actinobacterial subgroup n=1 Tax=Candidatus Ozemobacter sibiricus TaxID=2268124 RepID=A0A367ZLP5_9BACT|nr:MAG: TldE/PmbA family protein, Actinobacterial subgroup [Candidatus Ozemobacter sibiricus]
MLGQQQTERILREVLDLAKAADEAEVVVFTNESGLTRFAENYIHQNVVERNAQAHVRVVLGKKLGFGSTNRVDGDGLREMVERALQTASLSEDNPDFAGLPADNRPVPTIDVFRPSTERFTPRRRAEAVARLIEACQAKGLRAAGAFETGLREIAIANSKGVFRYQPATVADFNTVVMSDDSSGFANASAIDVHDLDVDALAREAIDKAERSRHPIDLPAGEYPVVLEEYAVANLIGFLAYLGFNGMAYREGRTFLNEKRGQPIAAPGISIWDDGLDPRGLAQPFDFEGVAKRRVDLVKSGIAGDPVYDHQTASLAKVDNTGHALPAPNSYGPIPLHLFMAPGATPKTELAKGITRGIWVTRFHYVNPVQPRQTILTGMTRDGTFLIEDGQITRGIKNLRFTASILEALQRVEAIGATTRQFINTYGSTVVPALRIGSFSFSGATTF